MQLLLKIVAVSLERECPSTSNFTPFKETFKTIPLLRCSVRSLPASLVLNPIPTTNNFVQQYL